MVSRYLKHCFQVPEPGPPRQEAAEGAGVHPQEHGLQLAAAGRRRPARARADRQPQVAVSHLPELATEAVLQLNGKITALCTMQGHEKLVW